MNNLINFKEVLGHEELLVAEFFKGYGSQSMALDRIGVPNRVVIGSEIDVDAIISYASARHSQEELDKELSLPDNEARQWLIDRNIGYDFSKGKSSIPRMKKNKLRKLYNSCILCSEVGDISLIIPDELPNFDLMTYSFPCQSISVAGLQRGFVKGSGTTSSLLWECQKVINAKKPKYLLMENVKNLVSKKFMPSFELWCKWLETLGYKNYWKVLNAKDFGVPQNRERVFMISILGEHTPYVFPNGFDNGLRLKDILDLDVEEKYYISGDKVDKLLSELKDDESMFTLTSQDRHAILQVGNIAETGKWNNPQIGRVYSGYGCSPTLNSMQGGHRQPSVIVSEDTNKIIKIGEMELSYEQSGRVYSSDGVSPTVMGNSHGKTTGGYNAIKLLDNRRYRIRKLTPKECWRLMGVDDVIFDKVCESGISNSQLYKQAGNSIVVNVLEAIFSNLFTK